MRSASAIYNNIRTLDSAWYEWRVTHGNNNYGLDTLKRISVSYSLASGSGISIGNANATKCEMTFLESSMNWERMAKFTVQFKIHAGTSQTVSEWITLGTFYTDERSEDKYGNLSIVAYDAMLMMEQYWTDKIPEQLLPASYPITAKAWATMIQSAGLATFADLTQLDDTIEFVGLDTTTTIRDVLKTIAAAHGGNWVMTPGETLKLIQFENVSSGYSTIGLSTKTLESSPALDAVTGVHLETSAGTVMESGDDDGYVVKAICDVSDTAGIAELCLSRLEDYVFRPFEAGTAYLDPIVEIGDSVSIDGTIYQVMAIEWYVQKTPTATVYAPYDQEIDHEYTIPSEQAKAYRKTMSAVAEQMEDYVPWDEVSTAIEQNAESVVIAASGTYVTQTEYDAAIADIQNQLDGNIQSWSGNVVPTLNNAPAVDWTTTALKNDHVGDMYFINSDAGIPEAGSYYRFENNNGTYSWQLITDSLATEALAQAAAALAAAEDAQDTADAAEAEAQLKGRIFVVQPTPPYAVGDLWFNSDQSEILTCMTARETGSFVAADWVKRNKYTDDSAFEAFQTLYNATITAIQDQIDQKAETYYQPNDPSLLWGAHPVGVAIVGIDVVGIPSAIAAEHTGDLWYRTTDGRTFYWDGEQWIEETVSDEVFDKIDGKAQVFINTPYTPYNVGDLWFNSASSEIMTCVTSRETGSFVQGDWQKRNKYTDDSALNQFVSATYTPQIAAIQADLDGKIDTYFYDYAPTLSNAPANQWTTTALKDEHVDDLFYNTTTGYTYRFNKSGSTYSWVQIQDADIAAAMQAASTAQDTADGKRRVFVTQPTNTDEYDVGDLWVNATYGTTYTNDILKCKTAKVAGVSFNINHWEKASKYTDDSAFTTFVNSVYTPEIAALQSDLDGKVDTYFYAYAPTLQNVPASQWTTSDDKDAHVDDLFLDTVSGYTYRYKKSGSTYSWERVKDSDITAAMSAASTAQDTADGKRRVFVTQPTNADEYEIGDLWVNATYGSTYSNDLLRCKVGKAAGSAFNIAHWDKASKYTDDTVANAVNEALTQFVSEFSVEPSQIRAEVEKRVIQDQQSTKNTFGWLMNDTSHTWYANNQEVMKVQQSGVSVVGSITATSGYIGNGASGFEIGNTYIRNGMQSLYDTTHDGVYVGVDGIALGKGKFKATYTGAVTASDLTINGGTISIGGTAQSPTFYVDANGNLYAQSGTFTGNVYASNIQYGGAAGTFNGAGITTQTITGGYNGQIDTYTIDDYNVAQYTSGGVTYGSLTTSSFSSGVQTSLYQADMFGLATTRGGSTYPDYFCATSITALSSMYANEFYIELGNDRQLALKTHYHTVTVNQDGTVQFGQPTDTRPNPFNVADTQKYKDDVAAVTVTSLDIEYTYDDEMHIYRLVGKAKNQAGETVYQSTTGQWNTDRSAYVDGKTDGAAEVTVDTVTQYSYSSTGDKSVTVENGYVRYNNGYIVGRVNISLNGNSNTSTCVVSMDGQRAYDAGVSDGASTAYVSNITTGNAGFPSYSSEDQVYYANVSITATARGTKSDGTYYTDDRTITRAVNVSTVYTTARTLGVNEGAQSAYVSTINAGAAGTPSYSSEDQVYYATVPITATARGTKADGSYYTDDRTINRAVDVTAVYNAGKAAGGININDVVVTRLYSPDRGWVTYQDSSGYHVGVLASVTANGQTKDENAVVSVDDIVNFFSLNNGSVISTNSRNYDEFDYSGYIQNALYTYNGYNYGRIKLTNSDGDMEYIVRVQFDTSGSGTGQITIVNAETSASVNPYYNATATTPRLPYYAYIGGKHYVYISATSTGVSNRTQYIDINDIVNVAYQQGGGGGGGSYSYYWSDEKSGPYGSKQRDCYFTVNGSIVQTAKVIWSSGNPSFQ